MSEVDVKKMLQTQGNVEETFFYKGHRISIIRMEHEKGTGYHFKVLNPCTKGEAYYSVPFIYSTECEQASRKMVRDLLGGNKPKANRG